MVLTFVTVIYIPFFNCIYLVRKRLSSIKKCSLEHNFPDVFFFCVLLLLAEGRGGVWEALWPHYYYAKPRIERPKFELCLLSLSGKALFSHSAWFHPSVIIGVPCNVLVSHPTPFDRVRPKSKLMMMFKLKPGICDVITG